MKRNEQISTFMEANKVKCLKKDSTSFLESLISQIKENPQGFVREYFNNSQSFIRSYLEKAFMEGELDICFLKSLKIL